ncbi:helix-turn-helix transcriptional regulator [Cellulomonas aerilata]|uniref:Helix-turn-helix transcriptional regulator n=2 Tax=Cellulomonas aerilata TaxID=515326 RepID=A0A512DFS8_9CELL|nr:helix-turn-helix transcriptional regulator [Cellulomonas aerilata]
MVEATSVAVAPLLALKLTVPPPREDELERERLLAQVAPAGVRLCAVVAPAGWGKTRLMAQWAVRAQARAAVAWLTLDAGDDDPHRFWSYLVTSVREATGLGGRALEMLSAPGVDPLAAAVPLLLDDLSGRRLPLVVVLDDYHVLTNPRVHEGVELLLSYLPPTVQLVVGGRADPPLPLARLRARGELAEVRVDDLRFTVTESAAVLEAASGVHLPAAELESLCRRTEGWAASLRLVALTLVSSQDPVAAAGRFGGDDRHVVDYLSDEVLEGLSCSDRRFLVRSSVLEQLSGALCDTVLGQDDSATLLDDLDRRGLFLQPLDHRRQWYRCHGLFRDVLRRELDRSAPAMVRELQGRAADWFADRDEIEQAVRYRLAAGDLRAATGLLLAHESWFFERGAAGTYLELGERALARGAPLDAQVLLMLAYASALCGRSDRVRALCDTAARSLDAGVRIDGWHSALAGVLTMRAAYGRPGEDEAAAALADARLAVDLEVDPTEPGHVVALGALAAAQVRLDAYGDAAATLRTAWACDSRALLPTPVLLQTAGLYAMVLLHLDDVEHAHAVAREVAVTAARTQDAWGDAAAAALTWLRLAEGRIAYRRRDLDAATALLRRAVALAEVWGRPTEQVMTLTSLAQAELAVGDRSRARDALSRAREVAQTDGCRPRARAELEAAETRLGRGAVRAARRVGRLHEELTDRELSVLRALGGPASQREIAASLFLSVNTVKGYTKSLYRKLGVVSRTEAVERGRWLGLI